MELAPQSTAGKMIDAGDALGCEGGQTQVPDFQVFGDSWLILKWLVLLWWWFGGDRDEAEVEIALLPSCRDLLAAFLNAASISFVTSLGGYY